MLTLIDRYILREVAQTWAAVTTVLLLILLSTQYVNYASKAAAGEVPQDVLLLLLGLSALRYLTVLVPLALFLAVILGLGRLHRDNETEALAAGGVGPARIYRPLLLVALAVAGLLAGLSFWLGPWAAGKAFDVRQSAERTLRFGTVEPGRFKPFGDERSVFYAEQADDEGVLHNVFIRTYQNDTPVIITASRAEQPPASGRAQRTLILYEGYRYQGVLGSAAFSVVRFGRHGMRYQLPELQADADDRDLAASAELWGSDDPRDQAELHWRLAVPLSAVLLTFLAMPLTRSGPRSGRSAQLLAGILAYLIYANLLRVGQAWLAQGRLPPELGLWWVHALPILGGYVLLAWQNGWGWMLGRRAAPEAA